jgi:hypothetical protein
MFRLCFRTYIVSVFIWTFICFQTYVEVFYLDVAYVCNGYQVFFRCFFTSVLEACFKCFIYLQTYVASVASECFKSKSRFAHGMHVKSGKGREGSLRAVW